MKQKYEGIRIVPTYYCSKNCSFCYQKTRNCGFMNNEHKLNKILNRIDFIPAYITFMGGELSCFPELSEKLMSRIHDRFPMVYAKSLITNGNGELEWYKGLKQVGITKIIFSCHSPKGIHIMANKIDAIATSAFFTTRVNCFLDTKNLSHIKDVVDICKQKDVPLTLCYDINQTIDENSLHKGIGAIVKNLSPLGTMNVFNNFTIVNDEGYQYWIYYHSKNYSKNNLIVLPDCSTTDDFTDVENCKGVI